MDDDLIYNVCIVTFKLALQFATEKKKKRLNYLIVTFHFLSTAIIHPLFCFELSDYSECVYGTNSGSYP